MFLKHCGGGGGGVGGVSFLPSLVALNFARNEASVDPRTFDGMLGCF